MTRQFLFSGLMFAVLALYSTGYQLPAVGCMLGTAYLIRRRRMALDEALHACASLALGALVFVLLRGVIL